MFASGGERSRIGAMLVQFGLIKQVRLVKQWEMGEGCAHVFMKTCSIKIPDQTDGECFDPTESRTLAGQEEVDTVFLVLITVLLFNDMLCSVCAT